MKKIIFLWLMTFNMNVYAQDMEFINFLSAFQKIEPYSSVGSYQMWQNAGNYIDNDLAWKFCWQKNKFMKPEETFCQAVGIYYIENKGGNIAVVIFFTGQKDNTLAYMLSIQTYDIKKGKMIDELRNVAGFGTKEGTKPACTLKRMAENGIRFTTNTSALEKETIINLEISNKGKIKEAK